MTLKELSKCYEEAAVLLRQRISELRKMMNETDDPDKIWHIKRRIAELTPMLTQMNDLSWLLDNYYEIGGCDRDFRYGFNGKRESPKKRATDENLAPGLARRINRLTATGFLGIPFRNEDHDADGQGTECEQKHHLPDDKTSGGHSAPRSEILPVLNQFFSDNPEIHRRNRDNEQPPKRYLHGKGHR